MRFGAVGLQGNFKADDLIAMLKTSKNRGKDAAGIFLDGKIQKGIDLNDFNDDYLKKFDQQSIAFYKDEISKQK